MGYDISNVCPIGSHGYWNAKSHLHLQYEVIHHEFGTMEDWEELAAGLKARGMKIMYTKGSCMACAFAKNISDSHDLVVNHTSDAHEWFKQSRSSKQNVRPFVLIGILPLTPLIHQPYRDYYIWRPARRDAEGVPQPPNNWASIWGGSAWQYDETTDECGSCDKSMVRREADKFTPDTTYICSVRSSRTSISTLPLWSRPSKI